MADPTNPTGAGGPPSGAGGPPTGGGGSPPFDPGTQSQFDGIRDKVRDASEFARKHSEEAERLTNELYKQVKVTDKEVDAYKEMLKLLKRKRDVLKEEWRDSKTAKKDLERIVALQQEALDKTKEGTKVHRQMAANLKEVKKLLADMPADVKDMETWLARGADTAERLSHNIKETAKALGTLGRKGTTIRGIGGIFEAMGVGKIGTKIDRRLEKIEEIKQAVEDSREMRKGATLKHMTQKRTKAIDEMRVQSKAGGLSVDPETGRVMPMFDEKGGMTKGGRHALASKMGFKAGSKKYQDFVGGEEAMNAPATEAASQLSLPLAGKAGEAIGEAAGEAVGDTAVKATAGWTEAMSEGGGAMEMLATVIEDGVAGLTAIAPEIMIPLEILAAAIEALSALFSMYLKQNQEMEKGLGKGGLFTAVGQQSGINSVADAFSAARNAMNTRTGVGALLGINWERNLAMASQMQDAGYSPFQSMTQGGDYANKAPGAMGEFMHGSVGEIQRIAVGAGRVGGLTDQEGIAEVIKLLGEYRETIASSENFMSQLNKDTQAAGISTAKYLQIVDEVSSHFDKMGKSLEQVTGVMRELSRYGDVSSETLKDMMDTLATATTPTSVDNLGTAAYVQTIMPTDILQSLRGAHTGTLQNNIDSLQAAGERYGVSVPDIMGAVNKGDFSGAQNLADSTRKSVDLIPDKNARAIATDAIDKINEEITKVANSRKNDPLARAAGQSLYGGSLPDQMANLFTVMRTSSQTSGLDMSSLLTGQGGAQQEIMIQMLAKQLNMDPTKIKGLLTTMRRETGSMLSDLPGENPQDQKKDARIWWNEFARGAKAKNGMPISIQESGLGKYWKGNMDDTFDAVYDSGKGIDQLVSFFKDHLDVVANSNLGQDKLISATRDGFGKGAKGAKAMIETSRGIALQTTSVGDLLTNIFQPLMIELVKGIDAIAKGVSWIVNKYSLGMSDVVNKSESDQSASMKSVDQGIADLTKGIDARRTSLESFEQQRGGYDNMSAADKKTDQDRVDQISTALDMLKSLQDLHNKGLVTTSADQGLVDAITKGQVMGHTQGGVTQTINNFFSSDSTINVPQDAGPSTSPGDQAKNMKPIPARRTNR